MNRIDVDRGVTLRQIVKFDDKNPNKYIPDPSYGGMFVYMYKDEPGKYYDVHGRPLPEGIAKRAGFPVEQLAKQRHKREVLKTIEDRLSIELALELGEEVILSGDDGMPLENATWKVLALPMDRAKVVDKETGEAVTAVPMPRPDAIMLFNELTRTDAQVKVIEQQAKAAKVNKEK